MWYVVQVYTGKEEDMRKMCERMIPEGLLTECFIPHREIMKRYRGSWHKLRKVLFPGYVFVVTEEAVKLHEAMRAVPAMTKMLIDWECITALTDGEVAFLERFGGEDRLVGMSVGFYENDKVRITEGPLIGMEGCIRKIDRHKRLAKIVVEMFGRETEVTVGVEIVGRMDATE